eukprot:NODE_7604_length_1564_cov_7.524704.p1 GENE.NODE_7604_length_1564_cov_7.524704~~NODE_7604_length_1564_cov_7.524704.p1  ORF type:complete len:464 (-),score=102.62 NODE_7604_length_1564_cov_7.524704:173-1447(-)
MVLTPSRLGRPRMPATKTHYASFAPDEDMTAALRPERSRKYGLLRCAAHGWLWRGALSMIVVSNLAAFVFECLWRTDLHHDYNIVWNPLAWPTVLTPVAWFYVFFVGSVHCPAVLATIMRGSFEAKGWRSKTTEGRGRWCSCFWVLLIATVVPFYTIFSLFTTNKGTCIIGTDAWKTGGHCICDSRPLLESGGTPRYVPAEYVLPELKLAFVGDLSSPGDEEVYRLISEEGDVSAVVLNGDLDYRQDHKEWKDRFTRHLGNLPFYVTVGNHDTATWQEYQAKTLEHYEESKVTECNGTVGVREVCTHANVSRRVPKGSGTAEAIQLSEGHSFVVLTGLGGDSVRDVQPVRLANEWWAANWGRGGTILQEVEGYKDAKGIVNGAVPPTYGVFFCVFHTNGDPLLARCYFKDVLGRLVDDFYVRVV